MFPLWLAIVITFFYLTIDCETDKFLLLLWLCNYSSFNTIVSRLVKKNNRIVYHQSYHLIENPVITF